MKGALYFTIYLLIVAVLFALGMQILNADEGNIAVNFSQVLDDSSTGFIGSYETDLNDRIAFEIDGDLNTGDTYRGKVHAELLFDISAVDLKVITNTTLKGYTLDTLGRDTNGYIAGTVKRGNTNIDIGIGGKQATPWGSPNAVSDLVPLGYSEDELLAIGADKLTPAPRGVAFQDGAFAQLYVATGWERGNTEIAVKGIAQLTGAEKAHQFIGSLDYVKELWENFALHAGGELLLVRFPNGLQSESALFLGIGYHWE